MRLGQWLKAEKGRGTALAAHLGVSRAMVSLIGKERVRVPQRHFRAIRDYTGGAVTLEELLPPVDHGNP